MVTITSNETNPIRFFESNVALICTVKLSPIAQEFSEDDELKVGIDWTLTQEGTPITLPDNELSMFQHSNNILCNNMEIMNRNLNSESRTILQCGNTTYKSIRIVIPSMSVFYNCMATITTKHKYYASEELSNETRFTFG